MVSPNLLSASASDIQSLLTSGQITSVSLIEQCLSQIEKNDQQGAELRAMNFITKRDKLMEVAARLDEERTAGKVRGPLHGIPIVIKDQWQTPPSYGMPCTAGMAALLEAKNGEPGGLVEKLEDAGLVILGKTNMSEFGGGKSFTTVGKSAVGGQCRSAYVPWDVSETPDLGHFSPGGSSVGSAVAVSAGYAPISISTEADGSTTLPGSRAALYALKMTNQTISLDGFFAISTTYASPGCMAKSATDLIDITRVMLEASNAEDKSHVPSAEEVKRGWEGITLGFANHDYAPIPFSDIGLDETELLELKSKYEAAITKIGGLGAKIHYPIDLPKSPYDPQFLHEGEPAINALLWGEIRRDLNAYLESLISTPVHSLEELIQWNKDHPEAQAGLDQEQHIGAQASTMTSEEHTALKIRMQKAAGDETIDRVMKELGLDAIVGTMESEIVGFASLAGYPCATMPLGVYEKSGRPFGLVLFARKHEEGKLLRIMATYEASFPPRALPFFGFVKQRYRQKTTHLGTTD